MKYAGSWELCIRRIDNSSLFSSFSIGVKNFFHRDEKAFSLRWKSFFITEKKGLLVFLLPLCP